MGNMPRSSRRRANENRAGSGGARRDRGRGGLALSGPRRRRHRGQSLLRQGSRPRRPRDEARGHRTEPARHLRAGLLLGRRGAAARKVPGVVATAVGYTGGTAENPSYEDVCGDGTGHAEAVLVEFDPAKVSYEQLLKFFWETHDPTSGNRQGPDRGTQYRSAIFTFGVEQQKAALASRDEAQKALSDRITTEIAPAGRFWIAEAYHH